MILKILTFGFLLCASAQDQIVGSGSGDSQVMEGSGESIVTPDPIGLTVNSSVPEIHAEVSNSSLVNPNNQDGNTEVDLSGESTIISEQIDVIPNFSTPGVPIEESTTTKPENREGKIEANQPSGESANEANVTLPVVDSTPVTNVEAITEGTVGATLDNPTPSYFQDNQQEGNSTIIPTKDFRLTTVEVFELSTAENACVVTAHVNKSVSSVQWIHDEAEVFTEAATSIVLESRKGIWKIKYVAPSPYRSSVGLKVVFFYSKFDDIHSNNGSCCLNSLHLTKTLTGNKKQLESMIGANITEIHTGLPEEMLIFVGLAKPTWDSYTKAAAVSVMAAAFFSILLGLIIACTRGRKREQKFFKEAAYPVELGRNLASDEQCKSSEYIISNVDTVSRSIPDPDDEECTWVVPIGEIHQAQGSGEVEDTKL